MFNYPSEVTKEIETIADGIKNLFLSCGTYDEQFFDQLPLIEDAFLVSFTFFSAKFIAICSQSQEYILLQYIKLSIIPFSRFGVFLMYQKQKQLEESVFGPLQTLALVEYRKIFQATGIDIDNRQRALSKRYESYTRRLETYIAFTKKINGFRELPAEDQAALFKGTHLTWTRFFGANRRIYLEPAHHDYHSVMLLLSRCQSWSCDHIRE